MRARRDLWAPRFPSLPRLSSLVHLCCALLCPSFFTAPANLPPHLQLPAALPFPAAPANAPTPSFCSAFRVGTLCCAFPAPLLYCDCSRSYKIVWTGIVSRETTSHNFSDGRLPNRGRTSINLADISRETLPCAPSGRCACQTGEPAWMVSCLADVSRETIPSTSLGAMRLSNRRGGPDNPVPGRMFHVKHSFCTCRFCSAGGRMLLPFSMERPDHGPRQPRLPISPGGVGVLGTVAGVHRTGLCPAPFRATKNKKCFT